MYINVAPMDWITDAAYRYIVAKVFSKYQNPKDQTILTTEFMSADWWVKNPNGVKKHLLTIGNDKAIPTIAQIFGGNLENLIKTAQDIQQMQIFDGIELNIGCPSPKIIKTGGGSALMKEPTKTKQLIIKLAQSLKIPFSIKTRTWFNNDLKQARFETLVDIAPFVKMITIHWRTYTQGHSWEVDREFVYRLKEKVGNQILIIGNGGILSYQEAQRRKQNLDGIAIGRWAIWNPWIITPHKPWWEEKKQTMLEHFELMSKLEIWYQQNSDKLNPNIEEIKTINMDKVNDDHIKSTLEFRKHFMSYIKGHPQASQLRVEISKIYESKKLKKFLSSI